MQSKKHLHSKLVSFGIAAVASFGLLDAVLLTQQHYSGKLLPCNITSGCETVLNSKYSEFLGVPIALFGVAFYLVVLLMALYTIQLGAKAIWLRRAILAAGTVGFVSSAVLVYIQGAVLQAWCQYCLLSALSSTVIFILSIALNAIKEKE